MGWHSVDANPSLAVPRIHDIFRHKQVVDRLVYSIHNVFSQAEALALELWIIRGSPPFALARLSSWCFLHDSSHLVRPVVAAPFLIMSTNSDPSITTTSLLDADSFMSAHSSAVRGGERMPDSIGVFPPPRGLCARQYSMYPRADAWSGSIACPMPAGGGPRPPRAASESPAPPSRACGSGHPLPSDSPRDARRPALSMPAMASSWYSSIPIARS